MAIQHVLHRPEDQTLGNAGHRRPQPAIDGGGAATGPDTRKPPGEQGQEPTKEQPADQQHEWQRNGADIHAGELDEAAGAEEYLHQRPREAHHGRDRKQPLGDAQSLPPEGVSLAQRRSDDGLIQLVRKQILRWEGGCGDGFGPASGQALGGGIGQPTGRKRATQRVKGQPAADTVLRR